MKNIGYGLLLVIKYSVIIIYTPRITSYIYYYSLSYCVHGISVYPYISRTQIYHEESK